MPEVTDPTATRRAESVRRSLSELETRNEPLGDDTPFPLGDLDTQDMDHLEIVKAARNLKDSDKLQLALSSDSSPAVAEGLARREAPESDPPAPPREEKKKKPVPPRRTQKIVLRPRGRAGWLLSALLAAITVALAATLYKDRSSQPLIERAQRFRMDVRQALASSRTLEADASGIAALRSELNTLENIGKRTLDLSESRAGVLTLEGLLGLSRGERLAAETAVREKLAAAPGCESALRGGLATLAGKPVAVEELSRALAEGIGRPELRGWRARARLATGLEKPSVARAVLSDLSAVAAAHGGRLQRNDLELKVHALTALDRLDEAAAVLKANPELNSKLGWGLTLSRIEAALDAGTAQVALKCLDETHPSVESGGDGSDRSMALAARTLEAAAPRLEALRERRLGPAERRELLALLHLSKRLGTRPLPDEAIDTLLAAVEAAAPDRKTELPGELCLAAAALGPAPVRRRVLVVIFRRLVASRSSDEQLELNLLLCLIVGVDTPSRLPDSAHLLGGLRDPDTQFELLLARALAWESFGGRWLRRALADLARARKLRPNDEEVEEIRKRILERLRTDPAGKRAS